MLKEYEPDDLEVRKRLYLSCFAWDKYVTVLIGEVDANCSRSISLCLGRPPSLPELPYLSSSLCTCPCYKFSLNEQLLMMVQSTLAMMKINGNHLRSSKPTNPFHLQSVIVH